MNREVRKTVGVYDRPEKSRWPRLAIIAVVILVLLIAASLAFGYLSSRSTATSSARSVTRSRCTLSTQRRRM